MMDRDRNCYVVEINSAPSLTALSTGEWSYRQTCMTKCFDWIIDRGKDRIPLPEERGGYRKFIHPAICERAMV